MKMTRIVAVAAFVAVVLMLPSCNGRKFHINGSITSAADSMLYLEHSGLDGFETIDSVKLNADGTFAFDEQAADTVSPEFYRLRIAGQFINLAVDSTETITVKAEYPVMSSQYDVKGSDDCSKIKELTLAQQQLQSTVDALVHSQRMSVDSTRAAIDAVMAQYKNMVTRNYIFKAPMRAYSYFALFQTIVVDGQPVLIFNPRNSRDDIKVFAAVATSWDTFYPGSERGKNLHAIAIQGMKDVRIMAAEQASKIDPSKVQVANLIDISLPDNHGVTRSLTQLSGKVVLLDFHLFAGKNSTQRIMMLRELYNKYHSAGFEIYQVSVDPDEHFWKTQTAALPWISVRAPQGVESEELAKYNVQAIPTFFLIDRTNTVRKRDAQITDLDKEIKALLAE